MMRLFCLSNSWIFLIGVVGAAMVALVAPQFIIFSVGAQILLAIALGYSVIQHKKVLADIAEIGESCARGDMERRIILEKNHRDMVPITNAINRLVDVSDAFIRESQATSDHAAQGKFYRTILSTGLNGAWKRAAQQINDASSKVRQNLVNSAKAAGNRLEASVMQTLIDLTDSTQQLVATSGELNNIAAQGSNEATLLSGAVAETSSNMSTIASAVEEMTASIKEISKQVQQTDQMSREVNEEGDTTRVVLGRLVDGSEKIGEVAELINTIASQINLLALNATIEAARAGDAGRGFTVVASEVKELATRTADATAQVEGLIQMVRDEVKNTAKALESILKKVSLVSEAACVISSAIEEQSATTLEISSRLQGTSKTTQQFAGSVSSMADASAKTRNAAGDMQQSSTMLAEASDLLRREIRGFIANLEAGVV